MGIAGHTQERPRAIRPGIEPGNDHWNTPSYAESEYWTLADGVLALLAWWRPLLIGTAVATLLTATIAKFAITKWYLATAIIRPTPPMAIENRITGLLSAFGGGASIAGVSASNEAEEYIPILQSFDFTMGLIQRHHLAPELMPESEIPTSASAAASRRLQWQLYNAIGRRFDYQFSLTTGNLTLFYEDPDPSTAERILGFFIEDLRDRLRRRQIQDAAAALNSLEAEIKVTGDVLLQSQLYELTAKQVQREKLAEVEADFAFSVLQSPAAPDRPHRPRVMLDSALAGVMTLLVLALGIILYDWRGAFLESRFELEQGGATAPGDTARLGNGHE